MEAGNIIIRRAVIRDAPDIAQIRNKAILAKAGDFYSAEEIADWASPVTEERIQRYKTQIESVGTYVFVAEQGKTVIGYAILVPNENELGAIYTLPNPRKGIGSLLLEKLEAEALAHGCTHLNCDASLNAEGFYQRHGFKSIERAIYTSVQGKQTQCVKMTKRLDTSKSALPISL